MVKSPVEGSSVALVRLQYQVVYSDFVRPICLPDVDTFKNDVAPLVSSQHEQQQPFAARYQKRKERHVYKEERKFFILHENDKNDDDYDEDNDIETLDKVKGAGSLFDEFMNNLKPETQQSQNFIIESHHDEKSSSQQWKNCQTLAWSRKDHLQRIQLKISEMKACENVSITTVNSLCAESIYYKQDCTVSWKFLLLIGCFLYFDMTNFSLSCLCMQEEEFPGTPIICPLPDEKRWSIIGVLPWKIGCSSNSIERFRLYDRVEPNSLWIRDVISSAN